MEHTSPDYSVETWLVPPGGSRTIDVASVHSLRVGIISGTISVVGHDGDDCRVEVEQVERDDVHVSIDDGRLSISQPKQQWSEFFGTVGNLIRGRITASITVMVPRSVAIKSGTTTADRMSVV